MNRYIEYDTELCYKIVTQPPLRMGLCRKPGFLCQKRPNMTQGEKKASMRSRVVWIMILLAESGPVRIGRHMEI